MPSRCTGQRSHIRKESAPTGMTGGSVLELPGDLAADTQPARIPMRQKGVTLNGPAPPKIARDADAIDAPEGLTSIQTTALPASIISDKNEFFNKSGLRMPSPPVGCLFPLVGPDEVPLARYMALHLGEQLIFRQARPRFERLVEGVQLEVVVMDPVTRRRKGASVSHFAEVVFPFDSASVI